jgi:hypothetical protein
MNMQSLFLYLAISKCTRPLFQVGNQLSAQNVFASFASCSKEKIEKEVDHQAMGVHGMISDLKFYLASR